jgi:hypothetical protein
LVPRPPPLRLRPPRGLRHGHRARRRLDLRHPHVRETIPFPRMLERLTP